MHPLGFEPMHGCAVTTFYSQHHRRRKIKTIYKYKADFNIQIQSNECIRYSLSASTNYYLLTIAYVLALKPIALVSYA